MNTLTKRIIGGTVLAGLLGTGLAVAGPAAISDAAVPTVTANVYSWTGNTTYTIKSNVAVPLGATASYRGLTVSQNGVVLPSTPTGVTVKPGTYRVVDEATYQFVAFPATITDYAMLGPSTCKVTDVGWFGTLVQCSAAIYYAGQRVTDSHGTPSFYTWDDSRMEQLNVAKGDLVAPRSNRTMVLTSVPNTLKKQVTVRSGLAKQERIIVVKYIKQNAVAITNTMRHRVVFGSSKKIADKEFHQVGSFYKKVGTTTIYKWKDFSKDAKTGKWQVKSSTQIGYVNGQAVSFSMGMPV